MESTSAVPVQLSFADVSTEFELFVEQSTGATPFPIFGEVSLAA